MPVARCETNLAMFDFLSKLACRFQRVYDFLMPSHQFDSGQLPSPVDVVVFIVVCCL